MFVHYMPLSCMQSSLFERGCLVSVVECDRPVSSCKIGAQWWGVGSPSGSGHDPLQDPLCASLNGRDSNPDLFDFVMLTAGVGVTLGGWRATTGTRQLMVNRRLLTGTRQQCLTGRCSRGSCARVPRISFFSALRTALPEGRPCRQRGFPPGHLPIGCANARERWCATRIRLPVQ
jgi:hypothetical protein